MDEQMTGTVQKLEEIADTIDKLHSLLDDLQSTMREEVKAAQLEMRKARNKVDRVRKEKALCSYCGKNQVYAKGYCRVCYSRYLRNGTPELKPHVNKVKQAQKEKQEERERKLQNWPLEIARLGAGDDLQPYSDLEETVKSVLSTLTPKEDKALLLRYKDGKSLREIGAELEVRGEWSRMLIERGKRKLKKPERAEVLKKGLSAIQREKEEREAQKAKTIADALEKGNEITIEELDLPVRAFNCLKRNGMETVADILSYMLDGKDLKKIRNLGNRSLEEILNKLDEVVNVDLILHKVATP